MGEEKKRGKRKKRSRRKARVAVSFVSLSTLAMQTTRGTDRVQYNVLSLKHWMNRRMWMGHHHLSMSVCLCGRMAKWWNGCFGMLWYWHSASPHDPLRPPRSPHLFGFTRHGLFSSGGGQPFVFGFWFFYKNLRFTKTIQNS